MKKSTRTTSTEEPLFSTNVPTLPRRQIIQSNLKNTRIFQEYDDDVHESIKIHSINNKGQESLSSFRRGDSTSRPDQANKKFEVMERRKSRLLPMVLFLLAIVMFMLSGYHNDEYSPSTVDNLENVKEVVLREEIEEEQPGLEHLYAVKNMRNINEDRNQNDISFYWHVPRCAGMTLKAIMGECLSLVSACEVGARDGHERDSTLDIITYKGARYVNIDTSSLEGIARARYMNLVDSTIARPQVIVSSYLIPISQEIFNRDNKGRAFALLRHPIERAVSMYYFNKQNNIIPADVTIEEYAQGQGIENNWMTRYLTGKLEGDLPSDVLYEAKNILKKKFLIGFVDDLHESIQRFIKYNNWSFDEDDTKKAHRQEQCVDMLVEVGTNRNIDNYDVPKKGSQIYSLIAWQNSYDIKLYEYAKTLFEVQSKLWGTKERRKADKKKKRLSGG